MAPSHPLQQARDYLRRGNAAMAEVLCLEILRGTPGHAGAHALLGLMRAGSGKLDEAVELLAQACHAEPGLAAHPYHLGLVHQQRNSHEEALAAFDTALRIDPALPQAHHSRGLALKNLDRLDEALQAYDHAIALQPAFVAALNNRATVLRRLGRYSEAVDGYRAALAHGGQGHAEVWSGLGLALAGHHQYPEALAAFERARAQGDNTPVTLMNIGVVLNELHRPGEALALLEEAAKAMPDDTSARLNLGNALAGLGRMNEALAQFRQVLAQQDHDADAALNIANTLRDMDQCRDALQWYHRALSDGAPADLVQWNRALCLLSLGDFQEGWRDYEARRQLPSLGNGPRSFSQPLWRGEPVAGKTVLLHAEQGLGDTIQFCRYARLVAAMGATVILEVQPPLMELLSSLEGVAQWIAQGQPLPHFDMHCPLMSLPLALGTSLETIPSGTPYLQADRQRIAHWKDVVRRPGRLQVGVAWAGNPDNWNDRRRSIPFDQFRAALPDSADFWSLQKSTPPAEGAGIALHTFDRTDFANTAAQIMALDLVVTVDTSIAHLAGALGRPVWILLSRPADMRWLLERGDSPWYPTARLLRQSQRGRWDEVLAQVAQDITRLTSRP